MKNKSIKIVSLVVILICIIGVFVACKDKKDVKNTTQTETVAKEKGYPVTIDTYSYEGKVIKETFDKAPSRVITTNQTATELLLKLGLGDKIVGTAYLDNPILPSLKDEYSKLKVLSDKYPTKEQALGVNPDFIFGWSTAFAPKALGSIESWNERGVNCYVQRDTAKAASPYTVNNFFIDVENLGKIFNIQKETTNYVNELKADLKAIKDKTDTLKKKKKVLILEAPENGMYRAYATTDLVGDMATLAGGVDPITKPGSISAEDIIKYNPDAIILIHYGKGETDSDNSLKNVFLDNPALQSVTAVKDKDIILAGLTETWGGGVRTVPTIQRFAKELYPNLYK